MASVIKSISISGTNPQPSGISSDGTYVWVATYTSNNVSQIQISTATVIKTISVGSNPYGISSDGTYVWVANYTSNNVSQIQISTATVIKTISISGTNPTPYGVSSDGTYVWVTNSGSNTVSQIQISSHSVINTITVGTTPYGISSKNNYVWVANNFDDTVSQIQISLTCFKEDTQILTNKGYIPVQELRKGDLVKTVKNNYLPIEMIGKKVIFHVASNDRIKDQLYKCSLNEYPELFEPLIITGCHSILVDSFKSEQEKQETIYINGDNFVTDNKYRLPVCVDNRSTVYEIPGNYTIYHFALENENYYSNYGIYANGLLVETCSKRNLKELSGMNEII